MDHIYELIGLGLIVSAILWFRRPRIEKEVTTSSDSHSPLLAQTLPPPRRMNLTTGPTQKKPVPSRKDVSNSSEHVWLTPDGTWARANSSGEPLSSKEDIPGFLAGVTDDSCEVEETDSSESESSAAEDSDNDTSCSDSSSSSSVGVD